MCTVLVIDDEPTIRALVRASLADEFEVIEASDGDSGLRVAREARPDLVLLDVALPGKSGLELCGLLRNELPGIQVLMMTGLGPDVGAVAAAGAVGVVTKPFDPLALPERIQAVLALPVAV